MKAETNSHIPHLSRRDFVRMAALASAGATLAIKGEAAETTTVEYKIIVFSKPFQTLGPDETAALVEEVGWSGIECPVREKGQIEPVRAADELPRYVDALRRRNLELSVLVTDITSIRDPHAEDLLRTASKLGIKKIRLGGWIYQEDRSIQAQLGDFKRKIVDIGQACHALGIVPGVQNHSGSNRIAAPVWDAVSVLEDPEVKHVGMFFDIGHATVEGGLSWPIQARLAEPYYALVYVKDFRWGKGPTGWDVDWCPLGEGMIHREFFTRLRSSGYRGPICQHHEYPMGGRTEMVSQMKKDLLLLKEWLA